MITDVQLALDTVLNGVAMLRSAKGAGRIFELYVMTGIAATLKADGFEVWLERSDETRIRPGDKDRQFIQRGGAPTGVASKFAGPANSSYIVFRNGPSSPEWEIWNGVQFVGRSGGAHEIDLAIVSRITARKLRGANAGGKPVGRPRVAIECKDVAAAGSVDEMRAFIARLYDTSLLSVHAPYFPAVVPFCVIHPGDPKQRDHQPLSTYRKENERTLNVIARRSGFVVGAAALTGYYFIRPYSQVKPTNVATVALFVAVKDWCRARGY